MCNDMESTNHEAQCRSDRQHDGVGLEPMPPRRRMFPSSSTEQCKAPAAARGSTSDLTDGAWCPDKKGISRRE
jgi:hypothetical protein